MADKEKRPDVQFKGLKQGANINQTESYTFKDTQKIDICKGKKGFRPTTIEKRNRDAEIIYLTLKKYGYSMSVLMIRSKIFPDYCIILDSNYVRLLLRGLIRIQVVELDGRQKDQYTKRTANFYKLADGINNLKNP